MILYRLSKAKYSDDLTGKGAEITGGRWNSKGTAIIYTCPSRALCTLEVAVHLPLSIVPKDYMMTTIEIVENPSIKSITEAQLPQDWQSFPYSKLTQKIGDQFVEKGNYLLLKVPSAIVQGDYNYLINPHQKTFKNVRIKSKVLFPFDNRLFM